MTDLHTFHSPRRQRRLARAAVAVAMFVLCATGISAQIRFSADFDNGRFDSAAVRGDTLALYPDVPLHVRMTGARSETRFLSIWRGTDYRMRSGHRMVYRYEGESAWKHCDTGYVDGEWYHFGSTAQFVRDTVYLAYWTPFTYGDMSEFMQRIASHAHVRNAGPRGITAQGRAIYGFEVTNAAEPDAGKHHVVVISRQHCVESPGNYVAQGMADFLMNDGGPTAEELRRRTVFHFYPMASPDLVYHGCDAEKGGYGSTNRQWAPGYSDSVALDDPAFEANILRRAIMRETGGKVSIGFDIHSHPGSIAQWYYWGAKSGPDSSAAAVLVDAISQRDAALHGTPPLLSPVIAQDLFSTSCDCADHWLHFTAGALAFTLEPGSVPPTDVRRTEGAGRAICEGILSVLDLRTTVETPAPRSTELTLAGFPNPFRDHMEFDCSLPEGGTVQLAVYDMLGRKVVQVVDDARYGSGRHRIGFSAASLRPGVYVAVMTVGKRVQTLLLQRLP